LAPVVYNSVIMAEPGEPLTPREREIVSLVATGATNRMIALQLVISPNTVKVHMRNIFAKLEINSRTEATVIAIREGWVPVLAGKRAAAQLVPRIGPGEAVELVQPGLTDLVDPVPLPPLPGVKRLYLTLSAAAVILVSVLAWPIAHSLPAAPCSNEFTADCPSDTGALAVGEPESLWVSRAPMPEPRGRFALVTLNGRLYVIGGETAEGGVGAVAVYDPQLDTWDTAADKPTPAANLAAVAVGDRIYALGGSTRSGDRERPISTLEIYDTATGEWAAGASLPAPLAAHAAVAWNGKVFAFGGWNGTSYTGDALAYDPAADRWERLPSLPTPRGFAGAAVLSDAILVIGGYDGQREHVVCETYHPQDERWETCASMSTPRGGVGAATVAGQVYVIGGGWESFVTFSERYHSRQGSWHNVETPLLLAAGEWRHMGVAAVGTRVYALGGWQGGRYLNVNQAYETLPNRLYLPAAAGQ
jgi:DNA-binding CsgD family transcriptional regulator/N-acetylneuraminic acid mutarotase